MKLFFNILACAAVSFSSAAQEHIPVNTSRKLPAAPVLSATAPLNAESGVNTLFTADVPDAHHAVWCENFDGGISSWTVTSGSGGVTWSAAATSGAKAFSAIDPADKKSLYVSGPYQTFKREISSLTSAEVSVPAGCSLECWVGFSQNYDSYCRLIVSVSDDNFATSTDVWSSKDETGDTGWRWHHVAAGLEEWSGKNIRIRLTYSWGSSDTFQTGGYMGDFYVDNLTLTGFSPVGKVKVDAGEEITFVSLVDADSYLWNFGENAVPSTSDKARPVVCYTAAGSYDVTLTVTQSGTQKSYCQQAMVDVEDMAPVAKIGAPATFRFADNRRYMVAPLAGVTFTDKSTGFPTSRQWEFKGLTDGDEESVFTTTEANPTVNYMYRHQWDVNLEVANSKGSSSATCPVAVEYDGVICNWQPSDYITYFDMDDWGHFPGSTASKVNITQYAERFSAPSRPITVDGVYLYFTNVNLDAEDVTVQIQNLGVHLYSCVDGQPAERLESWWWQCNELDFTPGGTTACWFPFTYKYTDDNGNEKTYMPPVVDDEFFIVVDGFPVTTDNTQVTLGMATWRSNGNTAYMYKDGKWQSADSYFGPDRNTSLAVMPYISHSVMTMLPVGVDKVSFGREGGRHTVDFFSFLGWKKEVECDADWCRITNTPSEYTLDELVVECDPISGVSDREAHIKITDLCGAGTYTLTVAQSDVSGVETVADNAVSLNVVDNGDGTITIGYPEGTSALTVTDVAGRILVTVSPATGTTSAVVDMSRFGRGAYIVFSTESSVKVIL